MNDFSRSLKGWRAARRLSQLDLALEAEISARHLSFLETGRAAPSREMVGRLGAALQLPLDARNQMLTEAGFAVQFRKREWDDHEMAPIRRAVTRQLGRHLPYPGLALDRMWTVLEMNDVARALFAPFDVGPGDSMLDLMMSDKMPHAVENWPEVAHHVLTRLRRESFALGGVPEFDAVVQHLAGQPKPKSQTLAPVVPTVLAFGEQRLSMFATIAQFGTPEDLMLDDMKIELYFPMDDETDQLLQTMAAGLGRH